MLTLNDGMLNGEHKGHNQTVIQREKGLAVEWAKALRRLDLS